MVTTTTGLATSFIQFTRTSNATVTDSNGFIEWAGHNLLTNSESFDASAWTKSSSTVTANSEAAPNGTTTGDTIAASGANGTALQSYTALAVPYTFSVWLKRKTGTGTIEIAADNGTYTAVTITSSWALYTVTQTPAAGSKSAGIRIVSSGDEVYAWGAHLYRSDLGGMVLNPARGDSYYPTTPPNLLGYTESLTTGWTNSNTTDSIVTETNPNGLASSVEVTATAGNGTLLGSLSLLASPYTFSIWLKRKTGTGTVEITVDGTTYVAAAVTGTWTRFSTTLTPTAGTRTPGIRLVTSGDAVYAWGAQLSDSASLDAYSPVYGAAVTSAAYYAPRLDFDPVTLAARGLLVEEQRTNLALWSSDLTNAAWTASNVTTAKTATGPDGAANSATTLTASAGNGTVLQAITSASAARITSCYIKRRTGTGVIQLTQDNGATWTAVTVTAEWTRVSITSATAANPTIGIRIVTNGDAVDVYGFQHELGAFVTSVIPTLAASATRSADVASVSTQAFPYSASEGTVVANVSVLSVANTNGAQLWSFYTDSNNFTRAWIWDGAKTTPRGNVTIAGSNVVDLTGGTVSANQVFKTAMAAKQDDFAYSLNGGTVATDTGGAMPTASASMHLGSLGGLASTFLNGHIRQITYIPRRLTNSELQARTV